MAVSNPEKVPKKDITSTDILSFSSGLDQRGVENADADSFTFGRNVMVDESNLLSFRYGLEPWLPDTVGTVHEVFPVLYDGEVYYFIADDSKVKYCQRGDTAWTNCGGSNAVTTTAGVITTFMRSKDALLILNNTDKTRYIRLSDMQMVQATFVADPTNAPTATAAGITLTGSHKIYYCTTFNTPTGTTASSPILTQDVSKGRSFWKTDGTEYLTVARNNTAPTGAKSWNLYVATAAAGGTIQVTDMLLLASGIDLATTVFVDNGAISIDIAQGTAPEDNSTEGFIAPYGIESDGRAILYGIVGDEYAVRISGDGELPFDFSPANNGYRAVLNEGTNYYPMSVVGFRNGQGIPSLTVLFSNTQGRSKQSILEQQTVTYGNYTFVVWGVTEQNYGAAGVSSPYAVLSSNGSLTFPTTAGLVGMTTEASMQNVISTAFLDKKFKETMSSIKPSLLRNVVGTAWADKNYYIVPSQGYNYNNQIVVYDVTNKERPKAYTFDIRSQWIGTVSPDDEEAFVYVCQDNHIYKLKESYATHDINSDGILVPFPTSAEGPLTGFNPAHNAYGAIVQVVFYLTNVLGEVTVGVEYTNRSGKPRTKSKTVSAGSYESTTDGNWSSPDYLFNEDLDTDTLTWGEMSEMEDVESAEKRTVRVRLRVRITTNEVKWFINSGLGSNAYTLRSISYEKVNLGVGPDLR